MEQDTTNELLEIISAGLINDHRTLADLWKKRDAHPEASETLDPIIKRSEELCAHLEKLRTDLRMAAVASRT